MTPEERTARIQGLRELADFLDAHPEVSAQWSTTYNVFLTTREELAAVARTSSWQKVYENNYFILRKEFCGDTRLDVYTDRETVCQRVVKGTKIIPAVPAQPEQPEREEEIVEWVCEHESLLADPVGA